MYNVKVRKFTEDSSQILIYSHMIYKGSHKVDNGLSLDRDILLSLGRDLPDFILSDIDDITVESLSFSDEPTQKKYVRDISNECVIRARKKIYDYTRSNIWEYFVTLTFDRSVVDSSDYSLCLKKVSNWLHNIRCRDAPDLKYLFVPEYHSDCKHFHFHGLIANVGDIKFVNSGHKHNGRVIYNLSGWSWGFSTASVVGDSKKVSNYIAKYINKDLCVVSSGRQRYICSQNLNLPTEKFYNLSDYDIFKLVNSVDKVFYVKTVSGYVSVQYLEVGNLCLS